MRKLVNKSGLSPVIATVLLIGIVVVTGLITFSYFRSFTQEAITKFGENIQLVCDEVQFRADYTGSPNNILSISNQGEVPIFGLTIKTSGAGGFTTRDIKEYPNIVWPSEGLADGGTFFANISLDGDSAVIVPILRGNTQRGGLNTFACNERHGEKILLG